MPRYRKDGTAIEDRGGVRAGAGRKRTKFQLANADAKMLVELAETAGREPETLLGELIRAAHLHWQDHAYRASTGFTAVDASTEQWAGQAYLKWRQGHPALADAVSNAGAPPRPPQDAFALAPELEAQIAAALGPTIQPSVYQRVIFNWLLRGAGNALVNAVAGSGKTTTLEWAARLLPASTSAVFVAFNTHIVTELEQRLRGTPMIARTAHSIGYQLVAAHVGGIPRGKRATDNKYRRIARELIRAHLRLRKEDERYAVDGLYHLLRFARLALADPDDRAALLQVANTYDVELPSAYAGALLNLVPRALDIGEEAAIQAKELDFIDMLWLPDRWRLTPEQFDMVFVDEAQDLSRAARELVYKLRKPDGGRLVAVGDPKQAIYQFAGADAESFWRIEAEMQAVILPLSVCYRCPPNHLALARAIVPQIEAVPGRADGVLEHIERAELEQRLAERDLVLCRTTAPLISLCLDLIGAKRAAFVRGRELSHQLTQIVEAIKEQDNFVWANFGDLLSEWFTGQIQRIGQREGHEAALEALGDRVACVRVCYERYRAADADTLCEEIKSLFSDAEVGGRAIALSTVHRAKGLEAARVFILHPELLPLRRRRQSEAEREQEMNLKYVALTRATQALVFVEEPQALRDRAPDDFDDGGLA